MFERVLVIVNPAAGKEFPILHAMSKVLDKAKVNWDLLVTKKNKRLLELISSTELFDYQAIVGYGGDGTITEIASTLVGKKIKLLPLGGGTGNTLSRELKIPQDVNKALKLLVRNGLEEKKIDTALINGKFFMEAVLVGSVGLINEVTARESKDKFGMWAYAQAFLEHIDLSKKLKMNLVVDDHQVSAEGSGLVILNSKHPGYKGITLSRMPNVAGGYITVGVLPLLDLETLAQGLAGLITEKSIDNVVKTWKAKKIEVELQSETAVLADETLFKTEKIIALVNPKSLNVLVPKNN